MLIGFAIGIIAGIIAVPLIAAALVVYAKGGQE